MAGQEEGEAEEGSAGSEPSGEPGQEVAGAPAADGKMTPERLLQLLGLSGEAKKREAEELVKQAQVHRDDLEAQKAEELLEQAVALDPTSEEANRLLAEVRVLLGDRRGKVATVAQDLQSQERVARLQARAEVRHSLNAGDRHVEAREYDLAIREYEKAIQMVRSFPFNLELDGELENAQTGLKRAQEKRREQLEEDRRQLEQRIRETREAEMASSVNLLQNQVRELRRKAKDAWDRQRYAQVEEISAQILTLLPEDADALNLSRLAREERHLQTQHTIVMAQMENHQRIFLGLDESAITYQQIFRYPNEREWQRLQPKVVTLEERAAAEESVVEKEIKRKLEEPQTLAFEPTPILDALKTLTQISSINFILTKEAQTAARDENVQVRLPQMREAPLKSILALLLASAGDKNFTYTVESGAVVIGTQEDLKSKVKLYREFYDVTDVTQPHPDYPSPRIALEEQQGQDASGQSLDIGQEDEERGGGDIEVEKLIELISNEMKDESGTPVGGEPKMLKGKLMISTTLENHQKIQRLLEQLRKATGIMITVESRFLDIQSNFLEEIGVDMGNGSNTFLPNSIPDIDGAGTSIDPGFEFTNLEQDYNLRLASIGQFSNPLGSRVNPFNLSSSGGGATQFNSLNDGSAFSIFGDLFGIEKFQEEAIIVGVGKEQSIRKLDSPRVTAFNTQVAHTLVINQAAYIQDLEVNQTGVIPVINPVIGILNSGSILEVRPTVSYDRKFVVLEIQPTLARQLQSEQALLNLSGNFTVVPVELPVLSLTKIRTTVTIPDGGTVLVGGLRREISTESSIGIPAVRRIPILNILFGRKGQSNLRSNLFVLMNAKITVVQEEEERLFNT